jgi:transcriptional regulator with XRE-family HTH domain
MRRLRAIRARKGVSLRELRRLSGVTVSCLALYEAGQGDPQLSTLRRLAKALGVTVAELIGEQPLKKGGRSDGTHKTKR